jgi:hypothetical protein
MMNFPLSELVPVKSCVDELPLQQDGRSVHPSTIARWCLYGLSGRKMPSVKLAGRRYVRRADLEQFLMDCAAR